VSWERFWKLEPEWLILWLAVLACLIAVAAYILSKIRAKTLQREPQASELLSKFCDLQSRGEITDEEFRTIKTKLAAQLHEEVQEGNPEG
jgi:uncharacterized membrane protein